MNTLFKVKMFVTKITNVNPFLKGTKDCEKEQLKLLKLLLQRNERTRFGKEHSFSGIKTYADFKEQVPVSEYEDLRPYILEQANNQNSKTIVNDEILFFNKTSGTTSEPKLIPVTKESLKGLKLSQQIMIYHQYKNSKNAFKGSVVGVASPAIEEKNEDGVPIGAASGHFYKSVSRLVQNKYVIPYYVFEIEDYNVKYYTIALFCVTRNDISYIATANPTTVLKLIEIINSKRDQIISDLENRTIAGLTNGSSKHVNSIFAQFQISEQRLYEVKTLFASPQKLIFSDLWPHLKFLGTWTGGSCGVALKPLLGMMPKKIVSMDLGYVSSEFRGTVVIDKWTSGGLPTYRDNFFEFVEKSDFENKKMDFVLLHQLKQGAEYYIFCTTKSGLYRYHMNDIMKVDGHYNQCPILSFIQKGKGVCNITGEKLYEGQLLKALETLNVKMTFVQVVGDDEKFEYIMYAEFNELNVDSKQMAEDLDRLLCDQNTEYSEKRKSNRLHQIQIMKLKEGTHEIVKGISVKNGQREGQYKPALLRMKTELAYDLNAFVK